MRPVRTFTVVPALPPALEPLREVAENLRWSWDHDTIALFRRLDPQRWEDTRRNPKLLLGRIPLQRLEEAAADEDFLGHVDQVVSGLDAYLASTDTWYARTHGRDGHRVAYFSAEFGVTDCLSIFAGGLGMLAGDHLKSASDLGIPMAGVGLLYQQGYFEQRLNDAGWQQEIPAENDVHTLPLTLERDAEGEPITIELGFPEGPLVAQIWRAQIGRVPLYMLDANVSANTPEQRRITHHLYGGDDEMRLRQEVLLGVGGYRALEVLGIEPTVFHMNEGHSGFLALEHIRRLMDHDGLDFAAAREAAAAALIFTTHTPVEAGHDYFGSALLERYFSIYVDALGIDWETFVGLGRVDPDNASEPFCMTVLGLKLAARANGVSRLHGHVSRAMWAGLWPGLPVDEVPIGHVTNGVHLPSWTSRSTSTLFDRQLGTGWREDTGDPAMWQRVDEMDGAELWGAHQWRRHELVEFVRRRVRQQREHRGAPPEELHEAEELLDPNALTIGFARRFATYKRATLFAYDLDRLAALLTDPHRPVQLIVAGKAHPRDDDGKELIRRIFELSREEPFRGRLIFVEDYGMATARYLVSGADVWLNNPLRPREASGTSGMKAAANGVLNLSTLDGWWDEAWRDLSGDGPPFGWAIGRGELLTDLERQERLDAEALYSALEHDVVPTFYDRGEDGVPWNWVARMKASITQLAPVYTTHRMLREYTDEVYLPAMSAVEELRAGDLAGARALAEWRDRVTRSWPEVHCAALDGNGSHGAAEVVAGEELSPRALVQLGSLTPADVVVEVYLGNVGADGAIQTEGALAIPMRQVDTDDGSYIYEAPAVRPGGVGQVGYTMRVRPRHAAMPTTVVPGCVTWADEV